LYLARPGADEVQLDLFGDYKSNVALYPTFQNYFRTHKPPFLARGAGTIRSSCRPVRRPSSATFRGGRAFLRHGPLALETHAARSRQRSATSGSPGFGGGNQP